MKKKWMLILIAALVVVAAAVTVVLLLTGGSAEEGGDIPAGDTAAYTDGNWEMTKEWTIARAESGEETLRVLAAQDATAWNTFFNLYERWSVSADFSLDKEHGASDCMRLVFGDAHGNVCLAVSVEYQGKERVLLKADALTEKGWKNVLLGEDWISVAKGPLNLKVSRENGKNALEVVLSQNGTPLSEATTKTMTNQVMDIVRRPGLSVYHTEGSFSSFAVVADRKPTDADAVMDGVIVAGDNVPTEEWLLGENAVHNLLNDKSAIVIDGERENMAWNAVNTLGDVWMLSFKVEFGKSYRDSVCARFMFGPKAETDGEYCGLVTVNYANSGVNVQMENKEGSAWITTATSLGWKPVASRSVNVELVKYPGINRVAIFVYEGSRLVFSTFSDEMSAQDMARYQHYGVMVYSSQVRFSEFGFTETADEAKMPDMTERVYPKISDLAIGSATATNDWSLSKNSVFFRENGKDAMVIDSKGEEFSYYVKNSIAGNWSMSAKVEFGTYYSDTAGVRIAFSDTDGNLSALLTVKYSPSDNAIDVNLQTYEKDKDLWTDALKSGWAKGESSFILKLSGDAKGNITIKVLSTSANGNVLYEKTLSVPTAAYQKMTVLGLGTISSQSKYSDIAMQLTGKAIQISTKTDPEDKTMYALGIGTPTTSDVWSTGGGITVNTDGALIIKSQGNQYSYNQKTAISDGFSVSTDVLFGSLDSRGTCTARIALVDKYQSVIGLFTVKFSENFEIMVEGQYNDNGTWHTCVFDNAWREVLDNRIHMTLSRAEGSNTYVLSIRDFGGRNVFYSSCSFPTAVGRKIAAFGLGADQATVKFFNISAQATGKGGPASIEDYGMLPIVKGTPATTASWSTGEGITYYSDGSLILDAQTGDLYSYHLPTRITDGFALTADAHFGSLDKNGVCSARIVLTDKDGGKLALFTVKFSQNFEVMAEGEYNTGSAWSKCVSDNGWHKAKDNRVKILLTRADGSNHCVLTVKDYSGKVLFTESCEIAQTVARRVAGIGIGVDASIVKFSGITIEATKGEERPEKEIVPITATGTAAVNADWTNESGVAFYSDGSAILTAGDSDVYSYYRHAPLKSTFTLAATVQFGKLDAQGVSTARINLTDASNQMVGLFTLKFSESFEVMAEGQYTDGGTWTGVLSDNGWNAVPDNFIALTLSRTEGSGVYTLVLRDSLGNLIYQASTSALPEAVNGKIAGIGIGCRDTQVKLTNLKLTSEGGTPDGEEPIVPGTQTTSADWTSGSGIAHYTDGSMIIAGSGDCFSYYTKAAMQGDYEIKTDMIFGTKAADNTATARVTLASSGRDPVGLFSVKYSDEKQILVEGQYYDGANWTTVVSSDWKDVGTNHVVLTLRAAGENKWQLTLAKTDGTVLYSTTTAALPKSVYDNAVVCGLGSYSSQVKFDGITVKTQGGAIVGGDEDIVPGTPTATADWHDDAGVTHYTDGSIIASASGDVYGFYTAKTLTDAYTLQTDVVFGTKGDGGNATARIALGDASYHPVGLFTLKCDATNKLLVEGQYYDGASWKSLAASGWLESGVKRVRVTLSKTAGVSQWSFTVAKTDGTVLFSTTSKEISTSVLEKCAYFGLGSYRSQVKFDKISVNIEGKTPDEDDVIIPGTPTATADWNDTAGITHYTDGSIIANGSGDSYSFNTAKPLTDAYTLQTDLIFGTKSDGGNATARVAIGSAEYHPAGLITLKSDASDKLLIEVQAYDGASWTTLGGSGWLSADVKRVRVTISKTADESQWGITVSKVDGTVLYSVKTAALSEGVLANAKYFGVGSYSSQVQFKNIALTVT